MSGWVLSKRQQVTNVGKDVDKANLCVLLDGKLTDVTNVEKHYEDFSKIKNRFTIQYRKYTTEYLSKEKESINSKT